MSVRTATHWSRGVIAALAATVAILIAPSTAEATTVIHRAYSTHAACESAEAMYRSVGVLLTPCTFASNGQYTWYWLVHEPHGSGGGM